MKDFYRVGDFLNAPSLPLWALAKVRKYRELGLVRGSELTPKGLEALKEARKFIDQDWAKIAGCVSGDIKVKRESSAA